MIKYLLLLLCFASLATAHNLTTYTYKTVGDLHIELDVYTPPSPAPSTGYPIFFAIHGGGYVSSKKDEANTDTEIAEIMRRGWVLVSIDHRLMPGVFIKDIMEDIQDAYTWTRTTLTKKTPVNPNAITVFGVSAGGGMATMCGYMLTPRPQAIIGFYSGRPNWNDPSTYDPSIPVDPIVAEKTKEFSFPVVSEANGDIVDNPRIDYYLAVKANRKMGWMAITHDPNYPTKKLVAELKKYSSVENVDRRFPPTYLAHGLEDTVVPYNQSVQLASSLQKHNIPHVLDLIPGVGHAFDDDEGNVALWKNHILPAFDFAQKYMQSSVAKISMKFLGK